MAQVIFIDPPNGSEFGFPKHFDQDEVPDDLDEWLLANGYPLEWLKLFSRPVPCRILFFDDEDPASAAIIRAWTR